MAKDTSWNDLPFYQDTPPEVKAQEFELQWRENQAAGEAKEQAGQYRPEPGGRGSNGR